jgi:hypothetical protein
MAPQPPRFHVSRAWIVFALALLAFNFYLGSRATQPAVGVPQGEGAGGDSYSAAARSPIDG